MEYEVTLSDSINQTIMNLILPVLRLEVIRAECIWTMATSQLNCSYNSSQFLPEVFRYMFRDSLIAADYYFTNTLIKDVKKAHGFSLLFDETTIVGIRK